MVEEARLQVLCGELLIKEVLREYRRGLDRGMVKSDGKCASRVLLGRCGREMSGKNWRMMTQIANGRAQ